jgi:hypothetical protein
MAKGRISCKRLCAKAGSGRHMGCFEDFIELREATERLLRERRREPQDAAKGGCQEESGLIAAG